MLAVVKWTSVVICAIALLAWVFSGWYYVRWGATSYDSQGFFWLRVEVSDGGLRMNRMVDKQGMSGAILPTGWEWGRKSGSPRWLGWFGYRDTSAGTFLIGRELFVPLWVPFVVCLLPTSMFRRRRPIGRGRCPCGYSRAGLLEDAPCPECGRAFIHDDDRANSS